MRITISNAKYTPRWEDIQHVISSALDTDGVLTRIRRIDGGCNYRAPGRYDLEYFDGRNIVKVEYEVFA